MRDWLSSCNQNKRKTVAPHITHLMCSLVLLLTISLRLVASCNRCLSHVLHHICSLIVLRKPCQENFGKFQEFCESSFGGSEKDSYFLNILKWQYKLAWNYKWGKLVSYFLNNAAKTCLYGLKISEKIELRASYFAAFKLIMFEFSIIFSCRVII